MDINLMLEALYRERTAIEQVIQALTRLNTNAPAGARRGRPPKWLQAQRAAEKAGAAGAGKQQPNTPSRRRQSSSRSEESAA